MKRILCLALLAAMLVCTCLRVSADEAVPNFAFELTANGAAELAVATKGMGQEVLDELQKAIDEKLGADFVAHSFVDPANEAVDDVQFVYVVEGVEAVDDEPDGEGGPAASEDGSTKATFIDRLLALFRPEP